jgi:hypothetical protein
MTERNKVEYARRGKDDPVWKELKRVVDKRDGRVCQVLKCLTLKEAALVQAEKSFNARLDRAHLLSAGTRPEFTYFPSNIRKISHSFHERLDNYRNLVTNESIDDPNERMWWAWRIATSSTDAYEPERQYELELIELIKKDVGKFEGLPTNQ